MQKREETETEIFTRAESFTVSAAWWSAGDEMNAAIDHALRIAFWEGAREGHRMARCGYDLPEGWSERVYGEEESE